MYVGSSVSAQITIDERETTELVLEIVQVAENNGLKLPREFGLLVKQVSEALYLSRRLSAINWSLIL